MTLQSPPTLLRKALNCSTSFFSNKPNFKENKKLTKQLHLALHSFISIPHEMYMFPLHQGNVARMIRKLSILNEITIANDVYNLHER